MFIKYFWKSITCTIIITILSCTPGKKFNMITFWDIVHFDKLVHFVMYFVLTIYLISGFDKSTYKKNIYHVPILISILYGGIIEVIQANFISNRSGDIIDFIFNSFGVLTALYLYEKLKVKKMIL